jgi:ParB-like chromosome segregation protein Spo0J
MNISLDLIDPNPHRDLSRNPVDIFQVSSLQESFNRTGFWENVVVRESNGRYQLAYGHNRWKALLANEETEAEFIVKPLSDYDMLVAMIDENATQKNQTPKIVNENIYAAVKLAESLLLGTKTVEEFNEVARPSLTAKNDRRASQHDGPKVWRADEYAKAKHCLESGQGLGKDFIKHFMPVSYGDHTLQVVLDSIYIKSRKKAVETKAEELFQKAEQAEEEAQEAEKEAATTNDTQIKERAEKRAKKRKATATKAKIEAVKTKAKAEKLDIKGFDRDLLERLETPSHMQELVQLARSQNIPSKYHAQLVDACIDNGWTTGGGRSSQVSHCILNAGKTWWYRESGQEAKDREYNRNRYQTEKLRWERDKTLNDFVDESYLKIKSWIRHLDAIKPFADQIENDKRIEKLSALLGALESVTHAVRESLPREENVVSLNMKRLSND